MKKNLVIYDLDGTLVETRKANYLAYSDALRPHGVALPEDYFHTQCFGKSYKNFIESEKFDDVHKAKQSAYCQYLNETNLNPHLMYFMSNENYYHVLATTASEKNCMELLTYYDIVDKFNSIYTQESTERLKPHTDIYEKIMQEYNIYGSNVLILEDNDENIANIMKLGVSVFKIIHF